MTNSASSHRRLIGTVVSTAMQKTALVRIDRRVTHAKYGKMYTVSKKFKVHDELAKTHVGDVVEFEECRPLSKDKRWRYIRTVTAAPVVGTVSELQDA
jgi:small subunit ribosomal protein S17